MCLTSIRNTGSYTLLYQQWNILEEKEEKNSDKKKIIDDLVVFINKLQANNHYVILTIDTNETFEYGKGGVENIIPMTNLIDLIACNHDSKKIPNTYQRGEHIVDSIFACSNIFVHAASPYSVR